jgi:hypothetical protein
MKMIIIESKIQTRWLKVLLFVLWGYALLGRGFAYFFLGEMLLVAGVFVFVSSRRIGIILNDPILMLWAIFALWGAIRTVPFLRTYRFDAVRDAVLWGYGFFAVLIVAFVSDSRRVSQAIRAYRGFLRWYLVLIPFTVIAASIFHTKLPRIPWATGADVALIQSKTGDAAVHLAGAAVFLLLFPDRQRSVWKQGMSVSRLIGMIGWFVTLGVVILTTRGGLLAIILSVGLASILRFHRVGMKVLALGTAAASLAVIVILLNPFTIRVKQTTVGPEQIVKMATSMVGGGDDTQGHEGTKEFRLVWWKNIIRDVVFGRYFWTGRGFGVNLAIEYGPPGLTLEGITLRSPHSGSMTVLARMGVPGLILWLGINGVFAFRMLSAFFHARKIGEAAWSSINLWVMCYWLAAFVDMSFDVYLEGPQGGIWFWVIIGFGIAVLRVQKAQISQAQLEAKRMHLAARIPQLAATA